jgi:hypothetical protein
MQKDETWADNIWRFNVAYNMGSGVYSVYENSHAGAFYNRLHFYNNTSVNCVRATSADNCGNTDLSGGGGSIYVYNELFYQGWSDSVTTNVQPIGSDTESVMIRDNSLAYSPLGSVSFRTNWTNQVHELSNVDPQLTNVAGQDFTLQSSSPARGAGKALTTASGSGSGSTSLTVAANTGSFFLGNNSSNLSQYGGNLVPGDFLTVGSCTAQVSSVSGDTITLVTPCTWSNGASVYFGTSANADIGAYPYKAGGYTLTASKSCAGSSCTITPNDPALVRFVICYEAGVPYTVVNTSPYTCAYPTGAFEARVYPYYASQTHYVTAN